MPVALLRVRVRVRVRVRARARARVRANPNLEPIGEQPALDLLALIDELERRDVTHFGQVRVRVRLPNPNPYPNPNT